VLFVGVDQRTVDACRAELDRDEHAWDVVAAATGPDGFRYLTENSADVVVSDFVTPGLTDGQFLAQVRKRFPSVARVVLSDQRDIEHVDMVVNFAHQFVAAPCHAWELRDALLHATALRDAIVFETARDGLAGLSVLPTPPRAFLDVVTVIDNPNSDARHVAAAIERDVALSAKVLQLTNSSFFAPRSRITSLNQAVVLMGRDVLRSVMLLDTVGRCAVQDGPLRSWLVEVNQRSWETAALARRLARPSVAEDAFCAALLLECGQLAFAACRPELFAELLRQAKHDHRHLDELEYQAFGVSHSTVGGFLLSLWGFPEEVVNIVALHADLPVVGPCEPDAGRVVQAAHQIASEPDHVCASRHRINMSDLSDWGVLTTLAEWKGERHPDHLGRTSAGPSTLMSTAIS
jgi:HD-like signal output (HDOD) protein